MESMLNSFFEKSFFPHLPDCIITDPLNKLDLI